MANAAATVLFDFDGTLVRGDCAAAWDPGQGEPTVCTPYSFGEITQKPVPCGGRSMPT